MHRGLKIAAIGMVPVLLLVAGFAAWIIGLWSVERHTGFFAPVWDDHGGVYFVQRDTFGATWGMGWEHFSAPAYTYLFSDEFSLRHLGKGARESEVLQVWPTSPLVERVTRHYRNRIFNSISAKVAPQSGGVQFAIRMSIPRVPRSESWALSGDWSHGARSAAEWSEKWAGGMGTPDAVLRDGVELIAIAGPEAFPAAILAVKADGTYAVLQRNDRFDNYYPVGVAPLRIEQRSRRKNIEKVRRFKTTHADLVAKYIKRGLRDGAASLKAYDDMEDMGLIPKSPRLVAKRLKGAADGLPVFDIPPDYFKVGLFSDIAKSIASPGREIKASSGDYLKYYDDDVGLRLKKWLRAGNDRFVVQSGGVHHVLILKRFERNN